ncbi:DUF2867 domain-containing protein [Sesbania bispinosa]|nr:DUF2867 domain-containing protein [Sesbania bispinosa]
MDLIARSTKKIKVSSSPSMIHDNEQKMHDSEEVTPLPVEGKEVMSYKESLLQQN